MKRMYLACMFISFLVLLTSCDLGRYHNADPFYDSTGEWDMIRFPLIKPYEAVSINPEEGWRVSLPPILGEPKLYGSVQHVQKIAVVNDTILVFTPDEPDFSQEVLEQIPVYYWYVIIPDKKIQRGFEKEFDFLKFIHEYDVDINEIVWESPESLFKRFNKTGCLEWIPECQ